MSSGERWRERGETGWIGETTYAHRGWFDEERPENSLGAFERAKTAGLGVELDVRIGGDDLVVFHDEDLLRVAGQEGRVLEMTRRERESLRLFQSEERIPILEEALEVIFPGAVIIEVKPEPSPLLRREVVSRVIRLASRYQEGGGKVGVHSFSPKISRLLSKNAPHLVHGMAAGEPEASGWERMTRDQYLAAPLYKPGFIAHRAEALPTARVSNLRRWGVPVLAWTVRSTVELERVAGEVENVIAEGEALEAVLAAGGFAEWRRGRSGRVRRALSWRR